MSVNIREIAEVRKRLLKNEKYAHLVKLSDLDFLIIIKTYFNIVKNKKKIKIKEKRKKKEFKEIINDVGWFPGDCCD